MNFIKKFSKKSSVRVYALDLTKVLVIFLMIVTHVIALTYDYNIDDSLVFNIGRVGGITSFIAFFLVFGMNNYFATIKDNNDNLRILKENRRKIFIRFGTNSIIYAFLAVSYAVIFFKLYELPIQEMFPHFYTYFTLGPIPAFSEFIITFIIFSLSIAFLIKIYTFLSKSIIISVLTGAILYFIGYILFSNVATNPRLNVVLGQLFGNVFNGVELHSFPLLQYAIVFLLGIAIGRTVYNNTLPSQRRKLFLTVFGILAVLTGIFFLLYERTKLLLFFPFPDEGRFPPSLGYLSLGLTFTFLFLIISSEISEVVPNKLQKVLEFFSKNSLSFLGIHLFLLFIYKLLTDLGKTDYQTKNIGDILLVSTALFVASAVFIFLRFLILDRFILVKFDKQIRFFEVAILPILLATLILAGIEILVFTRVNSLRLSFDFNSSYEKVIPVTQENKSWWNDFYEFKYKLLVDNKTANTFEKDSVVEIEVDHKKLLESGQSKSAEGKDLIVVYLDVLSHQYIISPIQVVNPNTANTKIRFKLVNNIDVGTNRVYALYFGAINPVKDMFIEIQGEPIATSNTLSELSNHSLDISLNKTWFLKNSSDIVTDQLEVKVKKNLDNILADSNIAGVYEILNSDGQIIETATVKPLTFNSSININISDYKIGTYYVGVKIPEFKNGVVIYSTKNIVFKVSYPLYVTWTFDWEGWDVNNYDLNRIEALSNKYSIPMVHLFNPRIYLEQEKQTSYNQISPERAKYLTDWVLRRKNLGDEIGMHLHMFADMVKDAGVTPRASRVIGAMYGDAATNDFSEEELEYIMKWGLDKFAENGLPKPKSYRTGGWFSSLGVLKAAQKSGFIIDTTGRTSGAINPDLSYSTQVPWNLQPTTRPYLPSNQDINKWEGNRLNIWEFPNNGADSYWFSASALIKRFTDNDSSADGTMGSAQVLTYLTHPHWYTLIDEPKIQQLFEYISHFKYSDDHGPVVFSTLENAYDKWDKSKINGN